VDNVILTPHPGAGSREAMRRMAVQVAEGTVEALGAATPNIPRLFKCSGSFCWLEGFS